MSDAMSGDLAEWPLSDLMFWLFQSGQTGVVHIDSVRDVGVLQFFEGRLIFASIAYRDAGYMSPQAIAEDAVVSLLQRGVGRFSFAAHLLRYTEVNVFITTEDLLLSFPVLQEEHKADSTISSIQVQREATILRCVA